MPIVAKMAMIVKVASEGLDRKVASVMPLPISMDSRNSGQPGTGKFAIRRNREPAINSGVETRKPSRIEIRYLFRPMASAKGISIFSSLSSMSAMRPFSYG